MAIIDSQVHCYEANTPRRPWHTVPNWPDHVTRDEMVAAMDRVGVDGAIFISAFSLYQYDASYAVEVQRAHPDRFALVKPVDPDDPAVADVIADWKKTPGTVGVRIMLFDAWGFDHCLWGTDWTRAFAIVNYEQAVEPFRRTERFSDSERAMLMGGACANAYGWSPTKD